LFPEVFFPQKRGRTETADLWRFPVPALTGCRSGLSTYLLLFIIYYSPPPKKKSGGERAARQGKRDKYRYEAECVTDVPIGYILNH
jgi:hypothetical protein